MSGLTWISEAVGMNDGIRVGEVMEMLDETIVFRHMSLAERVKTFAS